MQILRKIIWAGRNNGQIIGAIAGSFLGMLLMLGAIQFFLDARALGSTDQSERQLVQINKKVNFFNTLGASSSFSEAEVQEIEKQPFVQQVDAFSSNQFRVSASSPTLGFYTELFFESVPAEYLGEEGRDFEWSEGEDVVPILLSRDYLALYNFGFAPSQGLPQFTPGTIRRVPLSITIRGKGRRSTFDARIVGFTSQINSILVPQSFLDWANKKYGSGPAKDPSRLLLLVDNPMASDFQEFIQSKGYELSTGRLIGGQFMTLLQLAVGLIIGIGVLILFLSSLVFILNFRLLVAQAGQDIRLLLQVGYRPVTIERLLGRYIWLALAVTVVLSLLVLQLIHWWLAGWLTGQGFPVEPWLQLPTWLGGFILWILLWWINRNSLQRSVRLAGQ